MTDEQQPDPIKAAASAMGRKGGASKSAAKKAASRLSIAKARAVRLARIKAKREAAADDETDNT